MITTRNINAKKDSQRGKKLGYKTTGGISVKNLGEGQPLVGPAGPLITTHNIEEFSKLIMLLMCLVFLLVSIKLRVAMLNKKAKKEFDKLSALAEGKMREQ